MRADKALTRVRVAVLCAGTVTVLGWGYGCATSPRGFSIEINERPYDFAAQDPSDTPTTASVDAGAELQEEYWLDGSIKTRVEGKINNNGGFIRHGLSSVWYENGQKKSELTYSNGVLDGSRTVWFEDGQVRSLGEYIDGKSHGVWEAWYPNNVKYEVMHLNHGAFHGPYIQWHTNGKKRMEVEYVNGKRQGTLTFWDEEGEIASQTEYVDGVKQP